MTPEFVISFAQEAIKTTILVALPVLLLGLIVGLAISILQAVTQIHEMTLTFVPKILVILVGLILFGGWMLEHIVEFTRTTIEQFPVYIR